MGGGSTAAAVESSGILAIGNIQVAPAGISGPVKWETQGSEFRYDRPGPNGTISFVSGHGSPGIVEGGKVQRHIIHVVMNNLAPHTVAGTLASLLSNPAIRVTAPQQITVNGLAATKISTTDTTDELSAVICKQDWYFDPKTLLPVRVDFLTSEVHNAIDTAKMSYLFSDWRSVSGVLMPFQVVTLFEGQQTSVTTFGSIQIGVAIPAAEFDVPAAATGGAL
jgi:hypothetical protein